MESNKRALIVGIDKYQNMPTLTGCVADALAMYELLDHHEDGSPNYDCRVLTSADGPPITRESLRAEWHRLFENFDGHVLFHFSGHGAAKLGGVLVTQDGTLDHLPPVRLCKAAVSDQLLRELPALFKEKSSLLSLDPSYEYTHPSAEKGNIALFNKFKLLRNAHLLATQGGKDLYFIAMEGEWVKLTPLGQFYWTLARGRLI